MNLVNLKEFAVKKGIEKLIEALRDKKSSIYCYFTSCYKYDSYEQVFEMSLNINEKVCIHTLYESEEFELFEKNKNRIENLNQLKDENN